MVFKYKIKLILKNISHNIILQASLLVHQGPQHESDQRLNVECESHPREYAKSNIIYPR